MRLTRLLLLLGALLGGTAIGVVLLLIEQRASTQELLQKQRGKAERLQKLVTARGYCTDAQRHVLSWSVTRRSKQREEYMESKKRCVESLDEVGVAFGADFRPTVERLLGQLEEIQELMAEDTRNAAIARYQRNVVPLAESVNEQLAKAHDALQVASAEAADAARAGGARTLTYMSAAALLTLFSAGIAMAIVMRKALTLLRLTVEASNVLSAGDLSRRFASTRKDEQGDILNSLESIRLAWFESVDNLRDCVDSIGATARELTEESHQLDARTQQSVASLRSITGKMDRLLELVLQSKHATEQAGSSAHGAASSAAQSQSAMETVLETMRQIAESSHEIGSTTELIDSIAFQTNVLALNASIEAARAGAQGRGFSVLAGEVRQLAHRAASSAHQIKGMIENSQSHIDCGSVRVGEAGGVIHRLGQSVNTVDAAMRVMDEVLKQQHVGISEVGSSIDQLERLIGENETLVRGTATAVRKLDRTVEQLSSITTRFKLAAA